MTWLRISINLTLFIYYQNIYNLLNKKIIWTKTVNYIPANISNLTDNRFLSLSLDPKYNLHPQKELQFRETKISVPILWSDTNS